MVDETALLLLPVKNRKASQYFLAATSDSSCHNSTLLQDCASTDSTPPILYCSLRHWRSESSYIHVSY